MPSRRCVALILLAFVIRGGALLAMRDSLNADPDGYRRLAASVVEHGVLGNGANPTAYRPPLYPLALAPCVALGPWQNVAIALLHLALGMATVLLVDRLGRAAGLGWLALVGALWVACDPILLAQSALVMTETLATLLAVLAVAALWWSFRHPGGWRAATAGVTLGLASLCRPTFLPFAILAAVVLPLAVGELGQRVRLSIAFLLGLALALGPWAVRNWCQFGQPVLTTTHGGYTLLLGNNPQFYDYVRNGRWGQVWDAEELHSARRWELTGQETEVQLDRLTYREAQQNIARQPAMFVAACLVRMGRLWSPIPHQTAAAESRLRSAARYAVGLWYLVEFILAGLGLYVVVHGTLRTVPDGRGSGKGGARPHAAAWGEVYGSLLRWWLLLALVFTAVHALYWTDMRMRAPLEPGIALSAAAGLGWLVQRKAFRARQF